MTTWLPALLAALAALLLTGRLCRGSVWGRLDYPNERSLHDRPTPRSGGLAILAGLSAAGGPLGWWHGQALPWPLALATLLVAGVSWWEDWRPLSPLTRLTVHGLAAGMVVGGGLGLTALTWPSGAPWPLAAPWGGALSWLAVVWLINLYNFMDGMDGLAGGMGLAGFGFLALLGWLGGHPAFTAVALAVAGGCLGFLWYNFPPARIFMGDAGSTTLGLLAAGLSLWGVREGLFTPWAPLLIFAPFWVDATVTLLRRLRRGEKVWRPHRSHYYQRTVLAGWSHSRTVLVEYTLMVLGGASALALTVWPDNTLLVGLGVAWTLLYALLARLVVRLER